MLLDGHHCNLKRSTNNQKFGISLYFYFNLTVGAHFNPCILHCTTPLPSLFHSLMIIIIDQKLPFFLCHPYTLNTLRFYLDSFSYACSVIILRLYLSPCLYSFHVDVFLHSFSQTCSAIILPFIQFHHGCIKPYLILEAFSTYSSLIEELFRVIEQILGC